MINNIINYINLYQSTFTDEYIFNNLIRTYNINDINFVYLVYYGVNIEEYTRYELREKRKYQKILRKELLKKCIKCSISGISEEILLEVAHIVPVSECVNVHDKQNIDNVLLLWIDIHKFFDNYDISINPRTCLVETLYPYLKKYNGLMIDINDGMKKYLKHHYNKYIMKMDKLKN